MESHARDLAVERGLDLVVYTGSYYVVFLFILLLVLSIMPLMSINMCLYCQVPQNQKTILGWGTCLVLILLDAVVVQF